MKISPGPESRPRRCFPSPPALPPPGDHKRAQNPAHCLLSALLGKSSLLEFRAQGSGEWKPDPWEGGPLLCPLQPPAVSRGCAGPGRGGGTANGKRAGAASRGPTLHPSKHSGRLLVGFLCLSWTHAHTLGHAVVRVAHTVDIFLRRHITLSIVFKNHVLLQRYHSLGSASPYAPGKAACFCSRTSLL